MVRHPEKGNWKERKTIDHLGIVIDPEEMTVYMTDRKIGEVSKLAEKVVGVEKGTGSWCRWVFVTLFYKICVSFTVAVLMARSFTS